MKIFTCKFISLLLLITKVSWAKSKDSSNIFDKTSFKQNVAESAANILKSGMQTFELQKVTDDEDGSLHVHMKRYYKGLYVMGGEVVVNMDSNDDVVDTFSTLDQEIALDSITALMSTTDAVQSAQNEFGGSIEDNSPELIVYARGKAVTLAYHVKKLQGTCSDGTPADFEVILDANTLEVLESWNNVRTFKLACKDSFIANSTIFFNFLNIKSSEQESKESEALDATGKGFHNGKVSFMTRFDEGLYQLVDPSRGNNLVRNDNTGQIISDNDNNWKGRRQASSVDVHYGITHTWDYFKEVFDHLGFINDGSGALSYVNYPESNAYFSKQCLCFVFGDGDGVSLNPLTSIDVVSHEWAHGLNFFTAMLIYSQESGGLNEANSDIFATAVKYFTTNEPPNYLIGDKIFIDSWKPYLRTMIQPSDDRVSADCYFEGVGALDVHYSSGVANHFFYLLAEGTTNGVPSRTCGWGDSLLANSYDTVIGIGIEKATAIWYRALTRYFTHSTTYQFARDATVRAAAELFGPYSQEASSTFEAWWAVNAY